MNDTNANASQATAAPKSSSETTRFTYDLNNGLLLKTVSDDGQVTHFCYYGADGKDNDLPDLKPLLGTFKLEKDDAPLPEKLLSCPKVADTNSTPLLAQCSYVEFPDKSISEISITLFAYAEDHKNDAGALIPNTVIALKGVAVDTSKSPWVITKAADRGGIIVDLQQMDQTQADKTTITKTTSTRWYKNNQVRQTRLLSELAVFDSNAATLASKTTTPLKVAQLELTATVEQHIRSARSGRVLRESVQDELGRPDTIISYTYDARGRQLASTTTAWEEKRFETGDSASEEMTSHRQTWLDHGNGSWVSSVGPDGRVGRTLLDGLQRPVRRELQRCLGDDSAANFVCIEKFTYGTDGEVLEQCLYDFLPGGLCVQHNGMRLPHNLRDWFWQAEAEDSLTELEGAQQRRSESIIGTPLHGPLHSQEKMHKTYADGQVSIRLTQKSWNNQLKQLDEIGLSCEQHINANGQTDRVTEKVGENAREWTHEYDELGRRTQTTAPDGSVVTSTFKGLSNTPVNMSIKCPNGEVKQLGKQTLGRIGGNADEVLSRTVGSNDSAPTVKFPGNGYVRPDGTKVWSESSPDGTSVYWYTQGDKPRSAKIEIASFAYNGITQAITAMGPVETNLQSRVSTASLSPRLLGRLLTTRVIQGTSQSEQVQQTLRGEVTAMQYASGVCCRSWDDPQNRRIRVRRDRFDYRYQYATLGGLEQLQVQDRRSGRHLTVAFDHDDYGREIERKYILDGQLKSRYVQHWSVTGQLLTKRWYRNGETKPTRTEDFTYATNRNELLHWSVTAKQGFEILDAGSKAISEQDYTYDVLGNVLSCTTTYLDGTHEARNYDYANSTQPTRRTSYSLTHTANAAEPSKPTTWNYSHDKNGSLTTDTSERSLTYNAEGQLRSVSTSAKVKPLSTYEYDQVGRLAAQWDETDQTRRILNYNGDNLCGELWLDAQGHPLKEVRYDEEAGLVVQCRDLQSNDLSIYFVLTDPQNGAREEYSLDANGNWQAMSVGFTPWGEAPLEVLKNLNGGLGYNSQRIDPVTGIYHLGNGYRLYDPRHQAFYQSDSLSPFGEGGLNDMAYCAGHDPVNWHDPSGHIMVNRREEAANLASLDDMIRDTVPPYHEPAAWWEWLVIAGIFVLGVIGAALTGGMLGLLFLAVGTLAFGLGAAELALRQKNPALSETLGWASVVAGFMDASGKGLVKLGGVLMKGALNTARALGRSARLGKLKGLLRLGDQRIGRVFDNMSDARRYRLELVTKAPVKTLPGRISKKQRDLINASRPATPPANVQPPSKIYTSPSVIVDDLGDYELYRRTYNASDRLIMSFHGQNAIRGGKVEIPANSVLNHYAPATGISSTTICYRAGTNQVVRDIGLQKIAEGIGNITKSVPGEHFTGNYLISHFEKFAKSDLEQLVQKHNIDILVMKPNVRPKPLSDVFNTLDTANRHYKVYEFAACRASELKAYIPFIKLPTSQI
ncbi:RHS repeat domain-containing protein [Pseudomonas sp. FYR_11]|uniref:RHS repeat domain-containing protein n=1 Tax=Pseudomonas TaxID=286 RepID=UPI00370A7F05